MLKYDRFFDPDPAQKKIAVDLYEKIKDLSIVSPHTHVDPSIFSNPDYHFDNPVDLFIRSDHYVLRMLFSQGHSYEEILFSENVREIWNLFAENFYIYRATPTGIWLRQIIEIEFGINKPLTRESSMDVFDQIQEKLSEPEYQPRAVFERLNISKLATTDFATDSLTHHQNIMKSNWIGKIIPTFRPDDVLKIGAKHWIEKIKKLSDISQIDIDDFKSFIRAIEKRREFFVSLGATATDMDMISVKTEVLSDNEIDKIFQRALRGKSTVEDHEKFSAHMIFEMSRMSSEDGLVMQIHSGIFRNHNQPVFDKFGPDLGFDIPVGIEFTKSLQPLLSAFGNNKNFSLILFTIDESNYSRELAPLAGAYPSVKLGSPWWFNDSLNGMRRYFEQVMDTAGIYNTAGFVDDTRALFSISARHDVWRRAASNWLAGLLVRGIIDYDEAVSMALDLASGLAKKAYHL